MKRRSVRRKEKEGGVAYLIHHTKEGLDADHVTNMWDRDQCCEIYLKLRLSILDEGGVAVIGEGLERFLGERRDDLSQVMAFEVLLHLRVQLCKVTEATKTRHNRKMFIRKSTCDESSIAYRWTAVTLLSAIRVVLTRYQVIG